MSKFCGFPVVFRDRAVFYSASQNSEGYTELEKPIKLIEKHNADFNICSYELSIKPCFNFLKKKSFSRWKKNAWLGFSVDYSFLCWLLLFFHKGHLSRLALYMVITVVLHSHLNFFSFNIVNFFLTFVKECK